MTSKQHSSFDIVMTTKRIAALILIYVLFFELLSFLLIYSLGFIRPDLRLDLTIDALFGDITQEDLRMARMGRDSLLGWDRTPFDSRTEINNTGQAWTISWGADGARDDPLNRGEVLISTYGDSWTAGAEVNNDQTWQYALEELIGYEVKNFGVSGYGVGQAFLKARKHFQEGRIAPITMLVIYSDDLRRVVNNFRIFLNRRTHGKLAFKPSYRYLGGEIQFFPNPYSDPSMSLNDLKALALQSAKLDYWMSRWLYLELKFPFSFQVVMVAPKIFSKLTQKITGREEDNSIWKISEGKMVLRHILEQFTTVAKNHESVPVVVFFPVVSKWTDGRIEPEYAEFIEEFRADSGHGIRLIDLANSQFDETRFLTNDFAGHPSPYGNQVIARYIANKLRDFDLLPAVD